MFTETTMRSDTDEDDFKERLLLTLDENLKWVLTLPALVTLSVLMFYPITRAVYMSLFQYRSSGIAFVGASNYVELLTNQSFLESLWITAKFTVVSVGVSMVVGFGIAVLLNRQLKFRGMIQTLSLIPIIVSPTVIALLWQLLYTPGGIADVITEWTAGSSIAWLSDPNVALWAIVVTDIWQWTPLVVLVMLAGLQAIPDHVTEAAIMDGANRWQRFVDITLPYMRQLIVLTLIIRMIGSMREFAKVFVLTRGGPAGATNVVSIELYHEAFQFGNFGKASAMALILLVLVIAIAFLFVKIAKVEF
jgi:multiple sugar transport system permease protein